MIGSAEGCATTNTSPGATLWEAENTSFQKSYVPGISAPLVAFASA